MSDPTAGSIIYGKQIAHQYKLDGYVDAELIKINASLVKVQNEILRDWNKMTGFSQARAYTLLDESRKITASIKETISTDLAGLLGKVSAESAIAHSNILSFGGKAANVQSVMLNVDQMKSFWSTTTPVGGALLKDWVNKTFDSNTIDKIQKEIGAGLFKGESYPALGKRLKEGFGMTKTQIDTLTRTYVHSANIDALKRVYFENKDIIKELTWSAAKLKTTCIICLSLDGKDFPLEATPPCPQHPRCRCSLIPKTSFGKLGISKPDVAKFPDTIDITKNGKQWLLELNKKDLTGVIGPKRVQLLEDGVIKFDNLVNMDDINHIYIPNLKELTGDNLGMKLVKISKAEAEAAKAAEIAFEKMKEESLVTSNQLSVDQYIADIKASMEAPVIAEQNVQYEFKYSKTVAEAERRTIEAGIPLADFRKMSLGMANTIEESASIVPKSALPDYIGKSNTFKDITGRETRRRVKEFYGVHTSGYMFTYPAELAGRKKYQSLISLSGRMVVNEYTSGVWISNGYKSLEDITARKMLINAQYKAKSGVDCFFNVTGETVPLHEFGHVFYNKNYLEYKWESIGKRWYKETKIGNLEKPSEAFAEAFAEFFHNGGKRLPDYVKSFIEEVVNNAS